MRFEQQLLVAFLATACSSHYFLAAASAGGNPGGYGYQSYGQMQQQQQGSNWGSNGDSYNQPSDRSTALPPLPAGWTEHFDPSSGQPYYYNAADGTTTWDRPQPEETSEPKEEKVSEYADYSAEESRPSYEADGSDETPAQESDNEPTFRDYGAGGTREGYSGDSGNAEQPMGEQKQEETQQSPQRPWGVPQGDQQPSTTDDPTQDYLRPPLDTNRPNHFQNKNAYQLGQDERSDETGNRPPEQRIVEPSGPSTLETQGNTRVEPFGQAPKQEDIPQATRQENQPAPRRPTFQESDQKRPAEEEKREPELISPWDTKSAGSQSQAPQGPPRAFVQRPPQYQTGPERIGQRPLQSQPSALANTTQTETPRYPQGAGPAFVPRQSAPGAPFRSQPGAFQRDQGYPSGVQHDERVKSEHLLRNAPPPQQQLPPPAMQSPSYQSQSSGPPHYTQRDPSTLSQQRQYPPGSQDQYSYGQQNAPGQNTYGQQPRENPHAQYGQYGQYGQYPQQYGGPSQQASNQLVSQEESVSGALRGAFGNAWQGLVGFGNRTKTAVESAKNTVVSGAREATQTISSTSSNLLTHAKGTLSSVFEDESVSDQYSLTGRYGAPPPTGLSVPSHGQPYQGYPYQQQPRPQSQGYPPQGQYPSQGQFPPQQYPPQGQFPPSGKYPPSGQYPPGYQPPQPRDDPPYPQAQQEHRPPHGRPVQNQWQQPPGYPGQLPGDSRQQPPAQQSGLPHSPQRRPPGPGGQQQQPPSPQGQQSQDPWQHPGLGPDGF